ncbi:spindle pole body component-3 [Coleophoma crateriformis]|uniref:Spindle pole body component n=1 Tax=Coleophoma crateriformis TaxID=565419 RepID=A0A3D8QLA1_9HELO|nr:spindle pole body component-3 [Coleophoma crateriformis]
MSHIAKLGALTDELVTLLTSVTSKSDSLRFNVYKESALRQLRSVNYPRTNQFDVASRLEGLDEKFRVYNEDPLADALKERVDVVLKESRRWTPEILHLLLELSDQPLSKTRLEDLELLKEPEPEVEPPLKWRDIVAEEPLLREKRVWQNVDFGAESSDEEVDFRDDRSEVTDVTGSTSVTSIDVESRRRPVDYVQKIDGKEELEHLRKEQFWQHTTELESRPGTVVTELQVVREVLFMFRSLPTSLFEVSEASSKIVPSRTYSLKHASVDAYQKLTIDFARQGSAIMLLRAWTRQNQSIPLLQVLQSAVSQRIAGLDSKVLGIEQRFATPLEDVVVSITALQAEIGEWLRPFLKLSDLVEKLETEPYAHAFRSLELLYDECCLSQLTGDDDIYRFLGEIFFECFRVYLRPIRTWMEEGELALGDKVFFVSDIPGDIVLASLWQSRFQLRRTQAGILHAPRFLDAAAQRIFTTGKSVVILKHLNQFHHLQESRTNYEPTLDFETVCNPTELGLAPFAELFDVSFNAWVQSKHHSASQVLRKTLFDSCGLHDSLDALSYLYFLSDGAAASAFASSIFDRLDTLDSSWNDRFTLTSLIQSAATGHKSLSSSRVRANMLSLPRKYSDMSRCRRTVKTLASIELKYTLSWPILIVITAASLPQYQKTFTFLLQIRRSFHILTRSRLLSDNAAKSGTGKEQALYYSLRNALLWFTQTLYHYLTILVITPNTEAMLSNMKSAEDVDSMIAVHAKYIKDVTDQALLGTRLELIHKTILTILDLSIKLEDAHAANIAAQAVADAEQQDMMDLSYASLGLTPTKRAPKAKGFSSSRTQRYEDSSSEDEESEVDVDLTVISLAADRDEVSYMDNLRNMKGEFDRLVRFIASGLRGIARAGDAPASAKAWDVLGEMLELSLGSHDNVY